MLKNPFQTAHPSGVFFKIDDLFRVVISSENKPYNHRAALAAIIKT